MNLEWGDLEACPYKAILFKKHKIFFSMLKGLEKCSRLIFTLEIFHKGSQTPWEAAPSIKSQENGG